VRAVPTLAKQYQWPNRSAIFPFTAASILIRLRMCFGETSDVAFTVFLQTTRQFSSARFHPFESVAARGV